MSAYVIYQALFKMQARAKGSHQIVCIDAVKTEYVPDVYDEVAVDKGEIIGIIDEETDMYMVSCFLMIAELNAWQ